MVLEYKAAAGKDAAGLGEGNGTHCFLMTCWGAGVVHLSPLHNFTDLSLEP
jgi:hypothetical protein